MAGSPGAIADKTFEAKFSPGVKKNLQFYREIKAVTSRETQPAIGTKLVTKNCFFKSRSEFIV
jgi:hypothetical protein